MRKIYEDGRGWRYAVRETLRDNRDEAQAELDAYAAAHGWREVWDEKGASEC